MYVIGMVILACEQALRSALAAGREKEGDLATTSLESAWKKSCEILIGGNDSSIFHVFFNVCLHSRSFPLRADWRKSDSLVDKVPQTLLPFTPPPPPILPSLERPVELGRGLRSSRKF